MPVLDVRVDPAEGLIVTFDGVSKITSPCTRLPSSVMVASPELMNFTLPLATEVLPWSQFEPVLQLPVPALFHERDSGTTEP